MPPNGKPGGVAGLSLDLDGVRFGDSPRHRGRDRGRADRERRQQGQKRRDGSRRLSREEDPRPGRSPFSMPPSSTPPFSTPPSSSPLSVHHCDHRPQYPLRDSLYGRRRSNHRANESDDEYPPSPLGTTYRHDGLSIGRNYLRFKGSTLSERLSVRDLDVLECVGRGACSSVWKARRRAAEGGEAVEAGEGARVIGEAGGDPKAADDDLAGITRADTQSAATSRNQYYALKVFPLRDPDRRSMLVRELKLLCSFRCDCLVELAGAFVDDDGEGGSCSAVTLVLEYMDRGSLKDLICAADLDDFSGGFAHSPTGLTAKITSPLSKTFPEYAIAAVAYQILWGLGYLHFEGVLHRDVKPANVLVSSLGRVKLADFGIVSQRHADFDDEGTIMNYTVVGTARYMSPERLRGRPYTRPSDVWGAGLVLLEMCRGGDSPLGTISSVVELVQTLEDCEMTDFIPETASDRLREILSGCLKHSPQKRIPASILLSSPWFELYGIGDVDNAAAVMKAYLDCSHPSL